MAKVSPNQIPDIYAQWGKDQENGLPYSGQAVEKFIKDELKTKLDEGGVKKLVKDSIKQSVFNGGNAKLLTGVQGNAEALSFTTLDSLGNAGNEVILIGKPNEDDRFITISGLLSERAIRVGGQITLSYGFNVADYQSSTITNLVGSAVITVYKQGVATPIGVIKRQGMLSTAAINLVNYSDDLTSMLAKKITNASTINIDIAITHSWEGNDGTIKTATKHQSVQLTILDLILAVPNVNIVNNGLNTQVSIPYTVKGNGNKTVYLYKNGKHVDTHEGITATNSSLTFVQDITAGSANFQIVAETTESGTTVRSSSFYFDLFSSVGGTFIALKVEDISGEIQSEGKYGTPTFAAPKFSTFSFNYYVFNPSLSRVPLTILTDELDSDGRVVISSTSEQEAERKLLTYSKTIKSSNNLRVTFKTVDREKIVYINPMTSVINIELPTSSLLLNLNVDGRSNDEAKPAVWSYGDTTTDFTGINWQSNGWIKDSNDNNNVALLLQNGAKAVINYPLFRAVNGVPVTSTGCTFELLFKCSNATLDENDIITCDWNNNDGKRTGLVVTTEYVGVNTGIVEEYKDDDGNVTQLKDSRVGTQYAQDKYYKYTFVIDPEAPAPAGGRGLCKGYIDGILSYVAPAPTNFANLNNLPIVIDSAYADVYIKSIKYYSEPLTHDQCVDGFIIDQSTTEEIETLYNANDVLGADISDKPYMSPQRIHSLGHGVMIISPSTSAHSTMRILELNTSSDKKSYFGPFRIDYFAPAMDLDLSTNGASSNVAEKGSAFNFCHKECAIRVQGTTSTKRPRKNYRLHYNKKNSISKPSADSFIVGGVPTGTNFNYAMSSGSIPVPISCLKNDYVDSSMTHNTAGAVVWNEISKQVASLRNPAQIREYVNSVEDIKTRTAIDGFPIDVFAADGVMTEDYMETLEDDNFINLEYMGQYNFNNDKSKSGKVFGFDGAYTYNEEGNYDKEGKYQAICFEFLDNQNRLDNFQVTFNADGSINDSATYTGDAFNNALELRAPEDLTDTVGKSNLGLNALLNTDNSWIAEKTKRVFNFLAECAKQVAIDNGLTAVDLNTLTSFNTIKGKSLEDLDWTSIKFTTEAEEYFNMSNICAWYIWTDYMLAVDQRAKNMMLYTMDGKHWMFQYYDGDTVLGERNDCFLAYDYLTDRDTYDESAKQYALQGHDSWLWYLVRANFDKKLAEVCQTMRLSGRFSANYLNRIFNDEFVGSWSERQYNYSQDYKYIKPLTDASDYPNGYPSEIGTNYINTAQGSRESHRTYLITNRFNLLDSKYRAGGYTSDAFLYYGNTNIPNNEVKIVSSIPYYFGWNTSNTTIQQHQRADETNDYTVTLNVTGIGTNNPANVLGASRIKELTFGADGTAAWTVDATKDVKLGNLLKLVAKNMGSNGSGPLTFTNCSQLQYVDISNSGFSSVSGLRNSSKLKYLDVSGTGVTAVEVADGCPIETLKVTQPTELYLSNLNNLVYKGDDADDNTLVVSDWTKLAKLVLNNCPQIDTDTIVNKLLNSGAMTKYIRLTGINAIGDITWLDKFEGLLGIAINDKTGLYEEYTEGPLLVGKLQLTEYTEDAVVNNYRRKFPLMEIEQPDYTLIDIDETVLEEGHKSAVPVVTNWDNDSGLHSTSNKSYEPSAHITSILNSVHRYLGKLQKGGKEVTLTGNPKDVSIIGLSFKGRDLSGTMALCQLADANSTFFKQGYGSTSTRISANLDGKKGNGEVVTVIPDFKYKGINYNKVENPNFSRRFLALSNKPLDKLKASDEITVFKIDELVKDIVEETGHDNGLFKDNTYLIKTGVTGSVIEKLSSSNNPNYYVVRVKVKGYKKVYYPACVGTGTSLLVDANENILVDGTGSVENFGELYVGSGKYLYNGMPVIATIPPEAVYMYISVPRYISGSVTAQPYDIVLHKGTKFASGAEMNETNAGDWIADMEPEWQSSTDIVIASAEMANDYEGNVGMYYSPFDGNSIAAVGKKNGDVSDLNILDDSFQYSMRKSANQRGMQLIDYEASKIIAMLFVAKYGRRNSQDVLGAGTASTTRKLGATRTFGMLDSGVSSNASMNSEGVWTDAKFPEITGSNVIWRDCGSPNFLGIENVQGNVSEWIDRAYYANETAANCGKIRITLPDLAERRVTSVVNRGSSYPISIVWGKYCDFCSASTGATQTTGYSDYQSNDYTLKTSWASTRAIRRSADSGSADGGVFCCLAGGSVAGAWGYSGSRLLFRGNLVYIDDPLDFMALPDLRYDVDSTTEE